MSNVTLQQEESQSLNPHFSLQPHLPQLAYSSLWDIYIHEAISPFLLAPAAFQTNNNKTSLPKKKKLSFGILPTALPSAPAKSLGNQVDNTWTIAAGTVITKVITHRPSSSLCLAGSDASRHSILLARMVSSCYQK